MKGDTSANSDARAAAVPEVRTPTGPSDPIWGSVGVRTSGTAAARPLSVNESPDFDAGSSPGAGATGRSDPIWRSVAPAPGDDPAFHAKPEAHTILIGLPGAGKSTIARLAAESLNRPFIDLDAEIEAIAHLTIPEIFSQQGEQSFRSLEAQVSQQLAASPTSAILAPGGGWVANSAAVAHLRPGSRIIYLRVALDEAVRRIAPALELRPLFASGSPEAIMATLWDRRRALYEHLADAAIDTDGLSIHEVVQQVVACIASPWQQRNSL